MSDISRRALLATAAFAPLINATVHTDTIITRPGSVTRNTQFLGNIVVNAPNTIIENSVIMGHGTGDVSAIIWCRKPGASAIIKNCIIFGDLPNVDPYLTGVYGEQYQLIGCEIYNVVDGVRGTPLNPNKPSNTSIIGNTIRDLLYFPGPGRNLPPDGTHNDCIQVEGGFGTKIQQNELWGFLKRDFNVTDKAQSKSCIMLGNNVGNIEDIDISHNRCHGGEIAINGGGLKSSVHVGSVNYNRFGHDQYYLGTSFNDGHAIDISRIPNVTTVGNTYLDGSTPVKVRRP